MVKGIGSHLQPLKPQGVLHSGEKVEDIEGSKSRPKWLSQFVQGVHMTHKMSLPVSITTSCGMGGWPIEILAIMVLPVKEGETLALYSLLETKEPSILACI